MPENKPVLLVVVASVREGRKGHIIAEWFAREAEKNGQFEVRIADLKQLNLPLMTEPNHPRFQNYAQEKTWEWSRIVDSADAFAFVVPEYNHSLTASMANALDHLHNEWMYKPAVIVSYGGLSAGLRGAQELRLRLAALSVVAIAGGVALPMFFEHIQDGVFQSYELAEIAVRDSMAALAKWHPALASMRQPVAEAAAD